MGSPAIQVPLTTVAEAVRPFAQVSGRSSFKFFAQNILGESFSDDFFASVEYPTGLDMRPIIVPVPKHLLRKTTQALLLWAAVQEVYTHLNIAVIGLEVEPPPLPDSVRWIFGAVRIPRPVTSSAHITLTCEKH